MKIKSPLRYPGGKSKAVKIINQYFPPHMTKLVSPFFGGGSIEISQAINGVEVKGYDAFEPLVCFWDFLKRDRYALHARVKSYHPITKDVFKHLQSINVDMEYGLEKAAVFYVLNRSSFSGSTLSGGMSQGQRFTESNMKTLLNFDLPNLTVEHKDFRESIISHPDDFMYLDPPYLLKKGSNNLYGDRGSTHKDFAHDDLFDLIKDRKNWIMSYNDSEEITDLYQGFKMVTPEWAYGMSGDKKSKEVLIFAN